MPIGSCQGLELFQFCRLSFLLIPETFAPCAVPLAPLRSPTGSVHLTKGIAHKWRAWPFLEVILISHFLNPVQMASPWRSCEYVEFASAFEAYNKFQVQSRL